MTVPTVLLAPGAGGDPARYAVLADAIEAAGFRVIAPKSERFTPQTVTTAQMQARVDDLRQALTEDGNADAPVSVVGHSVGGWAALCLAGAQPWGKDGKPIEVSAEPRVNRLVLLAPTVGWFAAPGALDHVTASIAVHTGAADTVTPPETASLLRSAPVEVTITEHPKVGHYDFMSTLPPTIQPSPGLDHPAFLRELAAAVVAQLG